MFNKFKNLVGGAKKFDSRPKMLAFVAGNIYIAAADGEIEQSELDKTEQVLRSNPSLAQFGAEITQEINRYKELAATGTANLRLHAERQLKAIANDREAAEEVFVSMISSASADGSIEESEQKVLDRVGNILGGLRVKDYE